MGDAVMPIKVRIGRDPIASMFPDTMSTEEIRACLVAVGHAGLEDASYTVTNTKRGQKVRFMRPPPKPMLTWDRTGLKLKDWYEQR